MNTFNRLNNVLKSAPVIPFNDCSKFIIMSDCHRGNGSWGDDFAKNQNLYFFALSHYYDKKFTYIEIGDGDELWENKKMLDIINAHSNVFWLLSKFYQNGRLHLVFGNHDIVKRKENYVKNNLYQYYDEHEKMNKPLFPDIAVTEGLILNYTETNDTILLAHGHQGDLLNDTLWPFARFLVRHLWGPLEVFGVNNPTSPAKNYEENEKTSKKMINWCEKEKQMLIAGHTHKPVFPAPGEPLYFNDGSSIHPRCITGIEIEDGMITLIKWSTHTKDDGVLFVGREVLAGPTKLKDYFQK